MSGQIWACRVRCDWPDCTNETDALLDSQYSPRKLPDGWTDLRLKRMFINDYTDQKSDFCPLHSQCTIADMAAAPWPELAGKPA
jgi:hypothetical protein